MIQKVDRESVTKVSTDIINLYTYVNTSLEEK